MPKVKKDLDSDVPQAVDEFHKVLVWLVPVASSNVVRWCTIYRRVVSEGCCAAGSGTMNQKTCVVIAATGISQTMQATILASVSQVRPGVSQVILWVIIEKFSLDMISSEIRENFCTAVLVASVAGMLMVTAVSGEPLGVQ